jgi:hypothetical protein
MLYTPTVDVRQATTREFTQATISFAQKSNILLKDSEVSHKDRLLFNQDAAQHERDRLNKGSPHPLN